MDRRRSLALAGALIVGTFFVAALGSQAVYGFWTHLDSAEMETLQLGAVRGPALPEESEPPRALPLGSGPAGTIEMVSYTTRFEEAGADRARAHNVHLATQRLSGVTIAGGEVLSFNTRVGRRTHDAGYRMAPVISGGEIVDGMGGGTCQVASTLYAAALLSGLEVVEHRPHSRPSTYIAMGLDATVVWPKVDLKIRNPFPFPITVGAVAERGELRVTLWGAERPRQVDLHQLIVGTSGYGERVLEDPELAPGTRRVSQRGARGARIQRTIRITERGRTTEVVDEVRYRATHRIIRVGQSV